MGNFRRTNRKVHVIIVFEDFFGPFQLVILGMEPSIWSGLEISSVHILLRITDTVSPQISPSPLASDETRTAAHLARADARRDAPFQSPLTRSGGIPALSFPSDGFHLRRLLPLLRRPSPSVPPRLNLWPSPPPPAAPLRRRSPSLLLLYLIFLLLRLYPRGEGREWIPRERPN